MENVLLHRAGGYNLRIYEDQHVRVKSVVHSCRCLSCDGSTLSIALIVTRKHRLTPLKA